MTYSIDEMPAWTSGPLRPCDYRCEMCGDIFEKGWTDEEATTGALSVGVDPTDAGLVCDACYKLTPWGMPS